MPAPDTERLLSALRLRRVATARDLSTALGVSQPTVSRLLTAESGQVVKIGHARNGKIVMS